MFLQLSERWPESFKGISRYREHQRRLHKIYKTMLWFLKCQKNSRVCTGERGVKDPPLKDQGQGERPEITIELSQSHHPTLEAEQAEEENLKQQAALQQLLCVCSCSVHHSGCGLDTDGSP